jgi:hypothetical protein
MTDIKQPSILLSAMPEGIGDLTYASPEWVKAAEEVLSEAAANHAEGLSDLGKVSLCVVAHNPPAYLRCGAALSWHVKFDGSSVEFHPEELPAEACDFKVAGDHSVLSNMSRIQSYGKDPVIVSAAKVRLKKLSRWEVHGKMPAHSVLNSVLHYFFDAMAERTMPRFIWMTPEWVSIARYILSTRAASEEYADGIKDLVFTFSEEWTDTPRYAFPDGSHAGFWVRCEYSRITVGAGPLPNELEPADALTKGLYTPVVPLGRTVNAAMTEEDKAEQAAYSKSAFQKDEKTNQRPVAQSSPSGKGPMPPELSRIFMPLHDELSKRTSGELPSDYDPAIKPQWAKPLNFDRATGYDPSWVLYDQFDIYGDSLV